MDCKQCKGKVIKFGKSKSGKQRYYCTNCCISMQQEYTYQACYSSTNQKVVQLLKEGCGTRSISRILNISTNTVTSRILSISRSIKRPTIKIGQEYEVDEMHTYIGNKSKRICIAYALDSKTREVVTYQKWCALN